MRRNEITLCVTSSFEIQAKPSQEKSTCHRAGVSR